MPWKVFGHYALWKLKVIKINCVTWNWLKSCFSPLGVRFFSLCRFFNVSLSTNNKLANNILVDHPEKWGLFSDFQYGFGSSRSTADLLTMVFDRIGKTFNRSGPTSAVPLYISKVFEGSGLLCKLKSYIISGQIFGLMALSGSEPEVFTRIQS